MPSGSSGRYQSRIFNFVHQQSRRLTQQWEHTIRHVQVATKWGVEVLLYPVHILLQSAHSAERTLYTKQQQTKLQLEPETPLAADTPIQNVLETVKNLPLEEATATPPNSRSTPTNPLKFLKDSWLKIFHHQPTTQPSISESLTIPNNLPGSLSASSTENTLKHNHPVVRGVATNLVNRNLVLVTIDNEILDILTLQQQAKLADRIINEIANYWRCWRMFEVKKETALLPEIQHLLAKLTGSHPEQVTALPQGTVTEQEIESKYSLHSQRILAFLDAAVANLESNALVPVQQHSREIIQVAQTQLNIFLYGKEQLAARGEIAVAADMETQTLKVQSLIAAALNYFFGVSKQKQLSSRDSDTKAQGKRLPYRFSKMPRNSRLQNADLAADAWLTWSDLYGGYETSVNKSVAPSASKKVEVSNQSAAHSSPRNLIRNYQNFLQQPKPSSGLVQQQKSPRNVVSTQKKSGKVNSVKQITSRISQPQNASKKGEIAQHQSTQVEAKPDWIETQATLIGYEKHILEQLLELLDSIMLWLEEIVGKIIKFWQRLWQGK
ncbi:MAG: hypothetical protein KME32_05840 [Mojavia pulchra JT2-VF2]|jgi:hypothetical protein|uniref:Uncharacterized protein n=1 Tax=Mojavia pulchra JT2-VF2 TaxID=287848 RepID=A0A951UEM3_9NOST|nr:hypothetical protein [Mojavia pulchra JT2-VF2]